MKKLPVVMVLFLFLCTTISFAESGYNMKHPWNAASGTFARPAEKFKIYIWKEYGEIWVEFVPLNNLFIFICDFEFGIVQNDLWYENLKFEPSGETLGCTFTREKHVVKLTQRSSIGGADLDSPFHLALRYGLEVQAVYFDPTNPQPTTYTYHSPYFKSDDWTGLGLSNISSERADVTVYIYANDGALLATETKIIEPYGQTHFVTGSVLTEDGWIKIESTEKLVGLCLVGIEGDNNYMADVPMTDVLSKNLIVPHVAYGPQFDTTIYVSNPNDSETNVRIDYIAADGTIPYPPIIKTIPANGCAQIPLSDIAGGSTLSGGRVNIIGEDITAFAIYNNLKSGGRGYAGLNAFSAGSIFDIVSIISAD